MSAFLVFSPPDPDTPLIRLLNEQDDQFDLSEEYPLYTFSFCDQKETYLDQPWDLAICWEPELHGIYSECTKNRLRQLFNDASEGLDRHEWRGGDKELFILRHASGVYCHDVQDELIQVFFEYQCRLLSYSRELGIPNYQFICDLVKAIGQQDFDNRASAVKEFYRGAPVLNNFANFNEVLNPEKFNEDLVCAKHAIRNLILKGEATLNSITQSTPEKVKRHVNSLASKPETQIRDLVDSMQVLDMNWLQQAHADLVKGLECGKDLDAMGAALIEGEQAWGNLIKNAQENNDETVKKALGQYLTALNRFCETAEYLKNLPK